MSHAQMPLVVPSGMVFYTDLPGCLVRRNPDLARDVIHALNRVDRSRKEVLWSTIEGKRK